MIAVFSLSESYLEFDDFEDIVARLVYLPNNILQITSNPSDIYSPSACALQVDTMPLVDWKTFSFLFGKESLSGRVFLVTKNPQDPTPRAIAMVLPQKAKYISFSCFIYPSRWPVKLCRVDFESASSIDDIATTFHLEGGSFIACLVRKGWIEAKAKGDDKLVKTFRSLLEVGVPIEQLPRDTRVFRADLDSYDQISFADVRKDLVLYGILRKLSQIPPAGEWESLKRRNTNNPAKLGSFAQFD